MNATIQRFGYPETRIAEYDHWIVLLRASQPTLGSLVLAAKSDATVFADLDPTAFAELAAVSAAIEAALRGRVDHQKLNYLMLMMVDPHVHFHVIPRYERARSFGGREFPDTGWPRLPSLGDAVELSAAEIAAVRNWLQEVWPR